MRAWAWGPLAALIRVLILGYCAALSALLAGLAALYTSGKSLPPSDGAYGMSVWEILHDPFVFGVWSLVTLVGAIAGFVGSLWVLWKVNLICAIPLVMAATVVTAAATCAIFNPMLGALAALLAGVATMLWCRSRAAWRSDRPVQRGDSAG